MDELLAILSAADLPPDTLADLQPWYWVAYHNLNDHRRALKTIKGTKQWVLKESQYPWIQVKAKG